MKGTKEQRGITLIALIITIVVLLILAAVAISSITNDGILGYAQNAADKYNQAQKDEAGILQNYLMFIDPCGTKGSHTWGDPVILVASDCKTKTNGTQELTCVECGEKKTETIAWKHNGDAETACTVCGKTCDLGWHDAGACDSHSHVTFDSTGDYSHYHACYCEHCNWYFDDGLEGAHTYVNGTCTECGWTCTHEYEETTYKYTSTGHSIHTYCDACGKTSETDHVAHIWTDDSEEFYDGYHVCACGYSEKHSVTLEYAYAGYREHEYEGECTSCGMVFNDLEECHITQEGACSDCGAPCEHDWTEPEYTSYPDGHVKIEVCQFCEGVAETGEKEAHTWEHDGALNHKCTVCEYSEEHDLSNAVYSQYNASHGVNGVCPICNLEMEIEQYCTFGDDNVCEYCGRTQE